MSSLTFASQLVYIRHMKNYRTYVLAMRHYIDAAHQLPDSESLTTKKCCNLHGHTYAIDVELIEPDVNHDGFVLDFGTIKSLLDQFDHTFLNEHEAFKNKPTTAENFARVIFEVLSTICTVHLVRVCEGYRGFTNSKWVEYGNTGKATS